jgi:hypothetical protein
MRIFCTSEELTKIRHRAWGFNLRPAETKGIDCWYYHYAMGVWARFSGFQNTINNDMAKHKKVLWVVVSYMRPYQETTVVNFSIPANFTKRKAQQLTVMVCNFWLCINFLSTKQPSEQDLRIVIAKRIKSAHCYMLFCGYLRHHDCVNKYNGALFLYPI